MYKEAFNRLPEYFRKPNNEKLYYIGYGDMNFLNKSIEDVRNSRDLNKATGKTLDLIGDNIGQPRDYGMSDDEYRLWIKTKIIANNSNGDIPTINKVTKNLFGDAYVGLEELWHKEDGEIAAVAVYLKPKFERFPEQLINRVVAGGVEVYWNLIFEQKTPSIFIGAYSSSGEEIKVYPKVPKDITTNPTIYIGVGYESISEDVVISSTKQSNKIDMDLDLYNLGNLINQLEQIVLYSDNGGDE